MREGSRRPPEVVPEKLILDRHGDAVERGELVRRPVQHALGARAVVTGDIDDQRVVELAEVLDGLNDAADLVVRVRQVGTVDVGLLDEELLRIPAERIPLRQSLRPGGQLGVGGHDPEPLLVGEDGLAQFVPAVVEQVLIADLLDPLRRRMMRRVCAARYVVDEERLVGRDRLELLHVLDRVVGHRRGQIPAGIALEGVDGGRVAEQVRLPLAGVAADEAEEIVEAHAGRPLIEGAGLARLIEGRVVVLAEPRRRVAVLPQHRGDGAGVLPDHRVVSWESRRRFPDDSEALDVVVAPRDQRRARRRAQRRGVELGVAQPVLGDAVQRRGVDDAAERARRAEPGVVGHDRAARWARPWAAPRAAATRASIPRPSPRSVPRNGGGGGSRGVGGIHRTSAGNRLLGIGERRSGRGPAGERREPNPPPP